MLYSVEYMQLRLNNQFHTLVQDSLETGSLCNFLTKNYEIPNEAMLSVIMKRELIESRVGAKLYKNCVRVNTSSNNDSLKESITQIFIKMKKFNEIYYNDHNIIQS